VRRELVTRLKQTSNFIQGHERQKPLVTE
jgi:hypothetical protein